MYKYSTEYVFFLLVSIVPYPISEFFCFYSYKYSIFFFQAEDGIRDSVASRGLGDVYKRQGYDFTDVAEKLNPHPGGDISYA